MLRVAGVTHEGWSIVLLQAFLVKISSDGQTPTTKFSANLLLGIIRAAREDRRHMRTARL
jgi:hypothetical protein